jgi:hypothetical protein
MMYHPSSVCLAYALDPGFYRGDDSKDAKTGSTRRQPVSLYLSEFYLDP